MPLPRLVMALEAALLLCAAGHAQDAPLPPEIQDQTVTGINKQLPHATLMPYATLPEALAGKRRASTFARGLNGLWRFNWVPDPALRPVG
jgi:beta-galactosidase